MLPLNLALRILEPSSLRWTSTSNPVPSYRLVLFFPVHKYLLKFIVAKSRFYYNQFLKISDHINGMLLFTPHVMPLSSWAQRRIFYHLQRLYVKDPSLTLRMTPQLPQKQAILCGSVNSNHKGLFYIWISAFRIPRRAGVWTETFVSIVPLFHRLKTNPSLAAEIPDFLFRKAYVFPELPGLNHRVFAKIRQRRLWIIG